jgi:hypothetical protein
MINPDEKLNTCGDCTHTTPFSNYLEASEKINDILMCTCIGSGYFKVCKRTIACDKFEMKGDSIVMILKNDKLAKNIIEAVRVNWKYMNKEELTSIYKILKTAQKRVQGEIARGEKGYE